MTLNDRPDPLDAFDHASLKVDATALLLDFDGTLADIVDNPDAVSVDEETRGLLQRLQHSTHGAVAIVTGRPIKDIDRFLAPLKLPVAGIHGLERRNAAGETTSTKIDENVLKVVQERLRRVADVLPETTLETKSGSVALHYRRQPALGERCIEAAHEAVADLCGLEVLHGKMVVEIKAGKSTKANSVADFMGEHPFTGRVAVFAGDDVTDEDAFREIARRNGVSIKIGEGDTEARFRAKGTSEFRCWLAMLADSFDAEQEAHRVMNS